MIARARRLFALVLDTPGGIKISTIHAFCQTLLRRFPLEAGVSPEFAVIEERGAGEVLAEAAQNVIIAARGRAPIPNSPRRSRSSPTTPPRSALAS